MGASADQGDVVFVSYNRKDSETAHAIAAQLEQRGVRMWTDRQVRPGDTWMDQLGSAIMRARAAIVFKGPNGFGPWQSQEVFELFRRHVETQFMLIPALLPGTKEKNAGVFLANLQHVDFRAKTPNPIDQLTAILTMKAQPALAPSATPDAGAAHPLVRWVIDGIDRLDELERLGRHYVNEKRWAEASYVYQRRASLALDRRSNRMGF